MPDEPLQFEVKPKAKKRPVKAKPVPAAPPQKEKSVLPSLLILLVLLAAGFYWWQGQTKEKTKTEASNVQNELEKKITDLEKQLAVTKQPEKPAFVPADCALLGSPWVSFAPESYSLSFCYKSTWGAPALKEFDIKEEHTGTKWEISFPKVPYITLTFETPDFAIAAVGDVPAPSTFADRFTMMKAADKTPQFKPEPFTVRGVSAMRVYQNEVNPKTRLRTKSVQYFIPSAINGEYHLFVQGYVTGSTDLTPVDDSLKTLVDSLVF